MKELFVTKAAVYDAMSQAMLTAVHVMPDDVVESFRRLIESEREEAAKSNLELTVRNCVGINPDGDLLLCPDTGAPTFYVRVGDNVCIEGGFTTLWESSRLALSAITREGCLRPNLVHPISRANSGDNTGRFMPQVELVFDSSFDCMEVMAVPISGGSETSGTFFRMMSPVDGNDGILRFVLDCVRSSTYAGKTCPPNIIGIGIGGTADMCMRGQQAAVMRPIGTHHPEKEIANRD